MNVFGLGTDEVSNEKSKTWVQIAKEFNSQSEREKTPKQCRERWANFLDPTINTEPFSKHEEMVVFYEWNAVGPQWVKIAEKLQGRGDNAIKNCFNAGVR